MTTETMRHPVIERILAFEPDLSLNGFKHNGYSAPYSNYRGEFQEEVFREHRERMLTGRNIDAFNRACEWLNRQQRTKNVNPNAGTSYGLKHAAEKEVGYIPNGVFIAAAIACGFRIRRLSDCPNAELNISARSSRWTQLRQENAKLA